MGDTGTSLPAFLVVTWLQLLIPLGVGLVDLCRLVFDELFKAVPMEVGARSLVVFALIPESSRLTTGLKDLASSLLLL